MREDGGCVVDRMNEARPVVLEGIHKGAKSLVNPLVGVLGLTVRLRVVGCGQLKLRTKETAKLFLKGRYELRSAIGDYGSCGSVMFVDVNQVELSHYSCVYCLITRN